MLGDWRRRPTSAAEDLKEGQASVSDQRSAVSTDDAVGSHPWAVGDTTAAIVGLLFHTGVSAFSAFGVHLGGHRMDGPTHSALRTDGSRPVWVTIILGDSSPPRPRAVASGPHCLF
jgi:hypothetical protein|eukprot:CAMPEP_0174308880 /NCGR_PEP_ID=MMETSP0810-20121108/2039_1 /TAXON_ID=73025 ORGANISM="Eutreptiella gymnastica-like, Strain CCMP1594" /NCGR_SAMPLE_ID=MMETSP0810 /ASSEMBLY_ACC=CAM_ASM_000659 /LENGTH=115 /DNA_ID=CAMNT_0015416329 /DNA_START=386 /DNA_END=733 /DNA_ORIENTATION=+